MLHRASEPQRLQAGDWHLPYVTGCDLDTLETGHDARMVSVGRCAAVSYLNQGKRDPAGDCARATKNLAAGHMSPFEHVAMALTPYEWARDAQQAMFDWLHERIPVGNLWGWRQFRKTLPNEHNFAKILKEKEAIR